MGAPSNAQTMRVNAPSAFTWAAVSLPLPVRSRYATSFGPSTWRCSVERGEMFTRVPGADDPMKNTFWLLMTS